MLRKKLKTVYIVGYKSFIQKNLHNYLNKKFIIRKIKYQKLKDSKLIENSILINCSHHKDFYEKKYSFRKDRNLVIAKMIVNKNIKMIMLSTRQVYKPKICLKETDTKQPINIYGRNSLISEAKCNKVLNNKLLILRLSNIIGIEKNYKKKSSLMSKIISGLGSKKIVFDESFYLKKDLLPIRFFCQIMKKILIKNLSGVVNVGSGIPFKVKFLVEEIIKYKKVNLVVVKKKIKDNNFSLNTQKLTKLINYKIPKKKLFNEINILCQKVKKIKL